MKDEKSPADLEEEREFANLDKLFPNWDKREEEEAKAIAAHPDHKGKKATLYKDRIAELITEGKSAAEITGLLPISVALVYKVRDERGLTIAKRKRHAPRRYESLIIDLIKRGYTTPEILKEVKVSNNVPRLIADRHGLELKRAKAGTQEGPGIPRVLELARKGWFAHEIVEKTGITYASVVAACGRHRVHLNRRPSGRQPALSSKSAPTRPR